MKAKVTVTASAAATWAQARALHLTVFVTLAKLANLFHVTVLICKSGIMLLSYRVDEGLNVLVCGVFRIIPNIVSIVCAAITSSE